MKTVFKPLGIAAAVAAATAGYTGAVSAQEVSSRNLGDLGLIPFYTVQGGFATAIHIINTTNKTQVVKLRAVVVSILRTLWISTSSCLLKTCGLVPCPRKKMKRSSSLLTTRLVLLLPVTLRAEKVWLSSLCLTTTLTR